VGFSVEEGVAVEIENVKGKIISIVVETFYTCTKHKTVQTGLMT